MTYVFNEYKTLLGPVMSEKSMLSAEKKRCYVFKIAPKATKTQVCNAVEKMFVVRVESVNVVNVKGKAKRFKSREGQRSTIRKAYVRLAEGYNINFAQA